jgi:molybdate transport system substrate-binding protein
METFMRLKGSFVLGLAVVALSLGALPPARAETTVVAVAANFAGAAEALAEAFAKHGGGTVTLTTGSTGKLYAQIKEGSPFDIILSADAKTPERLESEGGAVGGTRFTYAIGRLTLWSAMPDVVGSDAAATLMRDDVRFVAIANPDLAPYGVAAKEALTSLGLWEAIQTKIVMGQNIGQVYSLADSGAATVAFVATSALDAPGQEPRGSRFDVPQDLFNPIRQDAVLLKAGADDAVAKAFLDYLKTEEAKSIIKTFGYGTS